MERAPASGATTPSSASSFMRHFRPRTSEARRNGSGTPIASPSNEDFSELNRSTSGFSRAGLAFPRSFSASSGQLPQSPQAPASPEVPTRRPGLSRGTSSGRPGANGPPESPGAPGMIRSGSGNGTNNPFGRMVRRISGAARADAPAAASPTSEARPNGSGSQPSAAPDATSSRAASNHSGRGAEAADAADVSPTAEATPAAAHAPGTVHRIRLVPHLEATRSLHFEPIERDVAEGEACLVKMGRFTDRTAAAAAPASEMGMTNSATMADVTLGGPATSHAGAAGESAARPGAAATSSAGGGGRLDSTRVAFKSKVVSRGHAELWCESGGKVSAERSSSCTPGS
jgi:hypothetical protein